MAPCFDYAVSSLLCTEDENLVLDDDFDEIRQNDNHFHHHLNKRGFYDKEILNGLAMQSDECLGMMIEKEYQHLPATDYVSRLRNGDLDLDARKEVVDWIQKVHGHFNFQPLSLYLSINYLDRFLSAYVLPTKAWMMQLLAVACISLACKLEETNVPAIIDLQVADAKFIFEPKTIGRMELLVLSTLKWRMQAVTPFSYLDYFINKIDGDQIGRNISRIRATRLVIYVLKGIDFLEFRPSEIAAGAAITAAKETRGLEIHNSVSVLPQHVAKDRVMKCVDMMSGVGLIKGPGSSSVPQSPSGVLEAACFSQKTDETAAAGSCANSCHNSPVVKRSKFGEN